MSIQEAQQFEKVGVDSRGGHLRLVHDLGGQRQPVRSRQARQRQGGVRNRNPFLLSPSAQQQRAGAHRPGGYLAQECRQFRQLFFAQQSWGAVRKTGNVFQVVPDQQRRVFLQICRDPPPLVLRRHVGEIQSGNRRPDLVHHPLQAGRLRGFKRRVEHPARVGDPSRLQEPPAQRQRQFRFAHARVPRQVHHRMGFQGPFQLPQFCLTAHQSILPGHRNLQVVRRRFFGVDHRRSQRVRLVLRDYRRLVTPRLVNPR